MRSGFNTTALLAGPASTQHLPRGYATRLDVRCQRRWLTVLPVLVPTVLVKQQRDYKRACAAALPRGFCPLALPAYVYLDERGFSSWFRQLVAGRLLQTTFLVLTETLCCGAAAGRYCLALVGPPSRAVVPPRPAVRRRARGDARFAYDMTVVCV